MMPIGQVMADHHENNKPMFILTADIPDEPHDNVVIKDLIDKMIAFFPNERIKMSGVEAILKAIGGMFQIIKSN